MNRRLSEARIRGTCRELLAKQDRVSGRALCAELRTRFGAVGKTERVFQIWREETSVRANQVAVAGMPANIAELQRRLEAAEAAAAENLARAERAEYREQAHQDKWAMEIDGLRAQLRSQPNYAGEIRGLQEQVLRLTVEMHAARAALKREATDRGVSVEPGFRGGR
jgi:hypothetical protein